MIFMTHWQLFWVESEHGREKSQLYATDSATKELKTEHTQRVKVTLATVNSLLVSGRPNSPWFVGQDLPVEFAAFRGLDSRLKIATVHYIIGNMRSSTHIYIRTHAGKLFLGEEVVGVAMATATRATPALYDTCLAGPLG